MSLFKKNPNEKLYPTGKKNFVDVIKNRGSSELLIWRQPEEDFNSLSTLIVMPGETAVFIKGGKIEQVFESGTYKLSTKNYPFLSRIVNAFSGGISAYNAVVYFVRKTDSHELRWGTSSPIQVIDPVYNIRTEAKARGVYKVQITNPELFVNKLAGNLDSLVTQEDLDDYFAEEFQSKIKTEISKTLNSLDKPLLGIDAYLDELSQKIKPSIESILSLYGLSCPAFSISGLDIEKSKYDAIDKSQIELISKKREALGKKAEMDILGENWSKQQSVEILKDLANNQSGGGISNIGAGLGMGIATATAFSGMAEQIIQTPTTPKETVDPMEKLAKLKKMLDANLITQEEYDAKKAEILKQI